MGIIRNGADGISDMPWIPKGGQSGLLTRIAATESVSLCARMKTDCIYNWGVFSITSSAVQHAKN